MTGQAGQDAPVDGAEVMRDFLPSSPFVQHLGVRLADLGAGTARLVLPYDERLVTIGTTIHGGAVATLADTAAMAAAWSGAPAPESLRGSTVDLTVHYLAPATETDLVAEARVLRRGRSIVHIAVDVSAGDAPVAHAVATYKLG
ncbi:PaaI family thioesterase [Nocardioides sp.]|uniref:PaaI family thioesterase n=1 Tax=Nocardioides sp. TaxID=35761 RepID=UPI001998E83C|nr:PaaI family thioesterase [Nocardioides sp.]MBC7277526.1 PaaI family thioesterase [Nocardioides sp.]